MKISVIGKPEGCKLLRIHLEVTEPLGKDSTILAIHINGDFFAIPEEGFELIEQKLIGTRLANLETNFDALAAQHAVKTEGICGTCLMEILRSIIHGI